MCLKRAGFTLIELAVAIAVSGICATLALTAWFNFRSASLHREQHYQDCLRTETTLQALKNRLAKGAVLVHANEMSLEWRDSQGNDLVLAWEDSVSLNERRLLPDGYKVTYRLIGRGGREVGIDSAYIVAMSLIKNAGGMSTMVFRVK